MLPILASLLFTACSDSGAPVAESPSNVAASTVTAPGGSSTTSPGSPTASTVSTSSAKPTRPIDPASAELAKKLAASSNAFGFDLWKKVASADGNVAVSPASLSIALSMTYAGAGGDTASQMAHVLHLNGSQDETQKGAAGLNAALSGSKQVTFEIANRLFAEKSYAFEDAFLASTKQAYGAGLEPVDFKGDAEGARKQINDFVSSETEKRITNLIPPHALTSDTRLVLTNAIYLSGDWQSPFDKSATFDADFTTKGKDVARIPTMHQSATFGLAAADGAHVVSMPYAGGGMSMLLVVPDAVDGLAAIEASLDQSKLDSWTRALKSTEVSLSLPKFVIDPADSMEMSDTLVQLGMADAFGMKADFKKIANPPAAAAQLELGHVFHKAFVKVDEKGTEAAAASAVEAMEKGAAPAPGVAVKADHPFLFMLRDDATGMVVFMGRVSDPRAH